MAKWNITRVPPGAKQAAEITRLVKKGWEVYNVSPNGECNLKRRDGYVEAKPKRRKKAAEPLPVEVEVEPDINHE